MILNVLQLSDKECKKLSQELDVFYIHKKDETAVSV